MLVVIADDDPDVHRLIWPVVELFPTMDFTCVASMIVVLAAATPLNFTSAVPRRLVPVIVTDVPEGSLVGENPVIVGTGLKLDEEVAVPPGVVTVIFPNVAVIGTAAVI